MEKRVAYRKDLDFLKGFAIIAVVLYHMGICESGYLGVDVFFVISGFLIIPKIVNDIYVGKFSYFSFLEKRLTRLLPLLLIVLASTLVAGYFMMLPDDYEDLSSSVIASSFFSNNILAALTTKNYWAILMEYRPLMHTWYIGVLFEFYLIFPLIALIVFRCTKEKQKFTKNITITTLVLSLCSLLLYLAPFFSDGNKFYLLPFRLFELSMGGVFCC